MMFVPLDENMPAVLVDTETGTVLNATGVRAVPLDVWAENLPGLDGASDSTIADFGRRYGFPLSVRVD